VKKEPLVLTEEGWVTPTNSLKFLEKRTILVFAGNLTLDWLTHIIVHISQIQIFYGTNG